MEINEINEQTKDLFNKVTLNGTLMAFKANRGISKTGKRWISIKGEVKYGMTNSETHRFEGYATETTSKGERSKLFDSFENFANGAVDAARVNGDVSKATHVSIGGNLVANDYVNKAGKLINSYKINAYSINRMTGEEPDAFKLKIDLEAVVDKIYDEMKNNTETGRKMMKVMVFSRGDRERLSAPVFFLDRVFIPEDIANDIDSYISEKDTVSMFIGTHNVVSTRFESMTSFGNVDSSSSGSYAEFMLIGGHGSFNKADDERCQKKVVDVRLMKAAKDERASILREIESNGYQGGASGESSSGGIASSNSTTNIKKSIDSSYSSDDDIPF